MADSVSALFDEEFLADIHSGYEKLRARGPVIELTTSEDKTAWLITGYNEVRAALADPRLSLDRKNSGSGARGLLPPALSAVLLNMDPPDHTRLRRLVSQAFTPRRVEALRPRIEALVDELLDAIGDADEFDVVDAVAAPLPVAVISELLGVPFEETVRFRDLVTSSFMSGPMNQAEAGLGLYLFLNELIAEKREHPADDLLTDLIAARDDEDRLDERELISTAFLVLFAGFETTVNLISTGVLTLLEHPDQLKLLRDRPELIGNAVEELLRFVGPVQLAIRRFAMDDVEIAGARIPKGATVVVSTAAANLDPDRFDHGGDLDIARESSGHLAFGHGIHFCLGAPLARLETTVAISKLLARYPDLRHRGGLDEVEWRPWSPITSLRGPAVLSLASSSAESPIV